MSNEIMFEPSEEFLVQISDKHILDRHLLVSVPVGYKGVVYSNGERIYNMPPCSNYHLLDDLGRSYRGSTIQIACFKANAEPSILYGVGDINVNNKRLDQAYRVGVNGTIMLKINDMMKLIRKTNFNKNVTVLDLREKLLPTIKTIATEKVGQCFANTEISVFEISSMVGEIKENMIKAIKEDEGFQSFGVDITSVSVSIFVPKEDIDRIRDKINNAQN